MRVKPVLRIATSALARATFLFVAVSIYFVCYDGRTKGREAPEQYLGLTPI